MLLVCGCPLTWVAKKQATVALSSAEAEYMAMSMALREIKWLHQMMEEIGFRNKLNEISSIVPFDAAPAATAHMHAQEHSSKQEATSLSYVHRPSFNPPTVIYSDNQSAIAMTGHSGSLHQRTKHIDVRHHFIQAAVKSGEIRIEWVPSAEQLADIFTKPLGAQSFQPGRDRLMEL